MSDVHAAEAAGGEAPPIADDAEYQDRAKLMGWRPKDQFKGDPDRWTDARTFVERGEKILPIVLERNRAMEDQLGKTRAELAEIKQRQIETAEAFMQFREFSTKAEERAYSRAKKEAEGKMNSAVDTADRAAYIQAKAELDALGEPPSPAPKREDATRAPPTPTTPPEVQEWIGENEWFNRDPVMASVATAMHGQLLRERPGMALRENLAEVRKEVMQRFPEKFGNPKRDAAPAVNPPTAGSGRQRKGKAFDDLPAEAKAACDRFVAAINKGNPKTPYTREEYVKSYFAGEE